MSNLLIIDTSTNVCTVILQSQNSVAVQQSEDSRSHGRFLLPAVNRLLFEQELELGDLDAIAVVAGPGSFTGIRIGVGVVQGLAAALEIPVILISSLEWLACSAFFNFSVSVVSVCRKAGEQEFYLATFRQISARQIVRIGEETVSNSNAFTLPWIDPSTDIWIAVGDGWEDPDRFPEKLMNGFEFVDSKCTADVDSLCLLAGRKFLDKQFVPAEQALPNYLKENLQYRTAT